MSFFGFGGGDDDEDYGRGYFFIVSQMNGLVLDVKGADTSPGTHVITYEKNGGDNQQFYDDRATGTIRTKLNGFCLEAEREGKLKIMPFKYDDPNQQWKRTHDGVIRNRCDHSIVIDVFGADESSGATVGSYEFNGGRNQMWTFEKVGGAPEYGASYGRRDCFIVSEMHGKVLDVRGGDTDPGTDVIMWSRHDPPAKNQLWYTDYDGYIRSALTDFALDAGSKQDVKLQPFTGDYTQQWEFCGDMIRNRGTGEVLDIARGDRDNGATVCSWKINNDENQKWRMDYV